jgi:hypothetical protein
MNDNRSSRTNGDRHRPRLETGPETAGTYTGRESEHRGAGAHHAYTPGHAYEREAHGREYGESEYGESSSTEDLRRREEAWRRDEEWRSEQHGDTDGGDARPQVPVTSLLRSLAGDAATLTRKEVALARSEMTRAIGDVKTGIVSAATGGSVLYAGLLFLLLSATIGLATVMDGWLAALIVGGVVTVIGLILVGTAKKKLEAENFRPDRTVDSLRKDQEMLHRRTSR